MKKESNGFGITALACGIVGFFVFQIVLGVLAIIFGAIGMGKEQKYATAGLVWGIVDVVFFFILMYVWTISIFTALI